MNKLIFGLLLISLFNSILCAEKPSDLVAALDEDNIYDFIHSFKYVVVEFYVPWCSYCKTFAPQYATLQKLYNQEGNRNIKIAKIDVDEYKSVQDKYMVRKFPTIEIFVDGQGPIIYKGENNIPELKAWIDSIINVQNEVHPAKTAQEFDALAEGYDAIAILWLDAAEKMWAALPKFFPDVRFIYTSNEEIVNRYNYDKQGGSFHIVRKFKNDSFQYSSEQIFYKRVDELERYLTRDVQPYNEKAFKRVFMNMEAQNPVCFLFYDKNKDGQTQQAFFEAAVAINYKMPFYQSELSEEYFGKLAQFAGATQLPAVYIFLPIKGDLPKKYRLTGTITKETVKGFVNDYFLQNLEEFYKSDPVPETNEGLVKEVVGDTFTKIVMDGSKDILVYWYSPFCVKCKELEPIYEEAARRLSEVRYLTFTKMNAATNDAKGVLVDDYPVIRFFPARNKQNSVKLNDYSSADKIIEFLRAKATWAKWPKNSEDL